MAPLHYSLVIFYTLFVLTNSNDLKNEYVAANLQKSTKINIGSLIDQNLTLPPFSPVTVDFNVTSKGLARVSAFTKATIEDSGRRGRACLRNLTRCMDEGNGIKKNYFYLN